MESYPKESNTNSSKEKLLYDINSSNYSLEENEYCPHIFDHFLNPYMNSIFKKITISSPTQNSSTDNNKSKKHDTIYFHNLSLFQNSFKTHIYWSYSQSMNLFNSFLLKNLYLDHVLYSNPQNLPINTINSDGGCIFSLNFNESGNIMAASNPKNLEIWDITKRRVKKVISDHKEITSDVAFLHGGENNSNFLTCSLDKTIKLYKNFENIYTFYEHNDWVRALSISYDNHFFLSGCVSSVVKLWDLNTKIVIGNIINSNENQDFMNTVNSLCFLRSNPNIFMVGLRSGDIKFFDKRMNLSNNNKDIILSFKAHNQKLNTAKMNQNDKYILTSGRDSTLRLWDFRKIQENTGTILPVPKNDYNRNFLNEYKKHKCTGYNVECNFYNEEKYLITGSETGSIFIYDILNTNLFKEIKTHLKCINLVKEIPNYSNAFAFSGLAENAVFIYDSIKNINKFYDNEDNSYNDEEKYIIDDEDETKQDKSLELCNTIMEDIMKEYGDAILKTFHKNNVTQNSGINFVNLLEIMERNGNNSGQNFNQIFINKFTQVFAKMELNKNQNDKNKKQEKNKENNIPKREIKCYECEMKNNIEYKSYDNNIFNCVDKDQLKHLLNLPNNFEFNVLNEI